MLYHKCHKINFKHGGLYVDSQDWIKKKNPKKRMINVYYNWDGIKDP